MGETLAARPPQSPPKNFNNQSCWTANSLQEYPKILTSYYSPRDIAGLTTSDWKFFFLQKIVLSQMPLFGLSNAYWKQGYGIID